MSWNKTISGLVAAIYLVFAYTNSGTESAFKVAIFLVFPMFCIWFADAMGNYTGLTSWMISISPSPGILVRILGWVLLLMPVILGILMSFAA